MKISTKIFLTLTLATVVGNVLASTLPDSLLRKTSDSIFHLPAKSLSTGIDAPVQPFFLDEMYDEGLLASSSIDSVQQYIDKARAVLAKVRETQNFISNLNDASSFDLPVGIPKTIGGLSYDIAIYAIRLKPTHAEVDVFMEFEVPQNGKVLTFMARGIKFTKAGGIVGDAKLQLVSDYAINFAGDKTQLVLKGSLADEGGTFVRMDCDGFKEMGLDAEVRFSRDLVVPENTAGTVVGGNVTSTFEAVLTNWNDLIVQVSLPSFQIPSVPGMGFSVRDAVFDFSDLRNATGVKFPINYNTDFEEPQLANLWRGIYLREVSIQLPPEFKSKGSTARKGFFGYDLLIDNQGFSGTVVGRNLIALNDGDMNGWAFSVDSIGVSLLKSQLTQAGFRGNIVVPVSDEQTPFEYNALISTGGNYLFSVSPVRDMKFNIWAGSKVDIYEASYLEVRVQDKKFLPKAILHGQMVIQAKLSDGGQGVELADIKFESLQIQSVKPYIQVGAFSFGSEAIQQKMAGFPISIQNIGMKNINDTEIGLDFNLLLNLTGESGGAFAADAGLTVIGARSNDGGQQRWRFKEIAVRSIKVDINGGAFKINGNLTFYKNDLAYGDGFNGVVKAEFTPGIKVNATAIFGSVTGQRYWYADAMASFTPGIPIFSGVAFYGFGGGAYYKMKMATDGGGSELGRTASGVVYVPDMRSGLGIKAILNIGSAPFDQAFNGDVTFEVAFFSGGGIRTISMTGNAFIATPKLDGQMAKLTASVGKLASNFEALEQRANAATMGMASKVADQESMIKSIHGDIGNAAGSKGAISARAFIQYDFENRELHGNFNVRINLANGIVEGKGDAVLHFAPQEWYVYVGTPDQRITLSMGIGPIRAGTTSYFMVGSKIPGSPPPPPEVSKILGGVNLDYMKDLNTIATGGGFAFGASFEINTGDLTFLMFYASFHAGAGFDIMLKNYGNTYCVGSNDRIGINGWYANGQVYAFFKGDIGLRVKVFGKKKKVEILNIAAAAILQAQFPNPFWMRGIVGGKFSALGGLVKGNCQFQVTLGKKCEMVTVDEGSALDNITVISQLTPGNGEKDVNVFNTPQVVFNMPVDKIFKLDENGVEKSFRIKLEYFKLMAGSKEVEGSLQWNELQDVVAFNSIEVLPPTSSIKALVQVSFEEQVNGAWVLVRENGQPIIEKSEVSFTTGTAPDYIPLENIEYSYPVIGQLNFYKDESKEGYIKLKRGQSYLFEPSADWIQTGRFTEKDGASVNYNFTYSSTMLTFTMPTSSLKNDRIYAFEILNVPKAKSGSVDRNVEEVSTKVISESSLSDTEVKSKKAEGVIEELQEKSILSAYFKTSKYASLEQKVNAINLATTMRAIRILWDVHFLKTPFTIDEAFDQAEVVGSPFSGSKPLISIEADLSGNSYYNSKIFPLIYEGYPIDGIATITYRDVAQLGSPPVKAVSLAQQPYAFVLNQNDLSYNNLSTDRYFQYDLSYYYYYDFTEIQSKVVKKYISSSTWPERAGKLIWGSFPLITKGSYKILVSHTLPGKGTVTSTRSLVLENPIE